MLVLYLGRDIYLSECSVYRILIGYCTHMHAVYALHAVIKYTPTHVRT